MWLLIVREERKQDKNYWKGKGLHLKETGLIDHTPCEDNEKWNAGSDTNYWNSNTILSGMSEMQPKIEIKSYANVLRRPVDATKKARVFLPTISIC